MFVELNLPDGQLDVETGGWPGWAINQLRQLEQQPATDELPSALILLSNFPEHRRGDELIEGAGMLLEGFNTNLFRFETVNLLDAIRDVS